jgi:phospholipid transport system substrate-binding protein
MSAVLLLRARALLAPLLVAFLLAAASRAEDSPARVTVERLDAAYLDVMKNATRLGYAGRFARFEPVLSKIFDFAAMARLSVGGRWKDFTPAQQAKLTETFGKLSVATHAGRFIGYSGERFEIVGEEPSTQGTVLVRTRVVIPGKDAVELDYRLHPEQEGWRIIDVFMNGTVSELALRRSEYSAVLDRDGFDGLITALDGKIADFATKPAAEPNP